MPCNSEYLQPNEREEESRRVARHLCYLLSRLGKKSEITDEMSAAKEHIYGNLENLDKWTADLCSRLRNLTKDQEDVVLYDGRSAQARSLADWWERHQAWDKRREAQERAEKKRKESDNLTQQFHKLPMEEKERLLALANTKRTP